MNRRTAISILASFLATPIILSASDEMEWEPMVEMDRQLFPSLIVSTATIKADPEAEVDEAMIGDPEGQIGVWIGGAPAGAKLKLVIKGNNFMEESTVTGKVPDEIEECWVYPKLTWKFDALLRHRQVEPLNVVMELFLNGKSQGTKSETVTVRSLNDCPLYAAALDQDGNVAEDVMGEDLSWMFAAYVNENHPWVDEVTKEALQAGIVEQFDGYQSGDPDKVLAQVFAVWNVLQRRGMKYSDISTESAASTVVFSQHVRLFDESVKATQANCVDGSVLFASVLRKIGINPYLVLVPGHCYLAFDLDAQGESGLGLETTLMGSANLKKHDGKKIGEELREQNKNNESWASFNAAIETGSASLDEAGDKFNDESEIRYKLISIAEARKMGILPLAYKKE
jgi:hypothetical protein